MHEDDDDQGGVQDPADLDGRPDGDPEDLEELEDLEDLDGDEPDGDDGTIDAEADDGGGGGGRYGAATTLIVAAMAVWGAALMIRMGPGETAGGGEDEDLPPPPSLAVVADANADADADASAAEAPPAPALADDGAAEADAGADVAAPMVNPEWVEGLTTPKKVTYTVKFGGSLKNVANLFKIYHHEIQALNPGLSLDKDLPPNTKVVVYVDDTGQASESIGTPSRGALKGGVPIPEGPGRILKAIGWKRYATRATVGAIDALLRDWAKRHPKGQPILVGNMSAREGGRLQPHSTHQSGRDVDLGYPQKWNGKDELNWQTMTKENLDAVLTWELLRMLADSGSVEVIYIDRSIQKLLYEHARKTKLMSKTSLSRWLEYPAGTGSTRALVQHVKGHVDHLHVRFACPPDQSQCKSRH